MLACLSLLSLPSVCNSSLKKVVVVEEVYCIEVHKGKYAVTENLSTSLANEANPFKVGCLVIVSIMQHVELSVPDL